MNIRRSIAPLVLTLAVTAAAGAAVVRAEQQSQTDRLASIGDLSASQLVEVRDKTGQVLLNGTFKTSENDTKETERKAELSSPTGQAAKGKLKSKCPARTVS